MVSTPISVLADTINVAIPSGEVVGLSIDSPVAGQDYTFDYNGINYTVTLPGGTTTTPSNTNTAPSPTNTSPTETNTVIGSATTSYVNSSADRATNIILATEAISGKILKPGERFSFNDVVGETTPEKGYKEGGVYIGNKVELGYGGGICQVSTTLYDAISNAGIIPTKRSNHSMPVSYVPLGLDATVANPYLDLAFVNPFDYPIYIQGINVDNKLTFNIYSDAKATNGITYNLRSEVIETTQPKTSNVDDPTLPVGQTLQDIKPSTGYKVKVYRDTIQNGKIIKTEYMYTDTYKVVDEVIKVGTKK